MVTQPDPEFPRIDLGKNKRNNSQTRHYTSTAHNTFPFRGTPPVATRPCLGS